MRKCHEFAVVHDLKDRGFCVIAGCVEAAAGALGVTRVTVDYCLR